MVSPLTRLHLSAIAMYSLQGLGSVLVVYRMIPLQKLLTHGKTKYI